MEKDVDLIERAIAAMHLGLTYKQLDAETELTRVNVNGRLHFILQEVTALQRARTGTKRTLSPGNPQARKIDLSDSGVKWGPPIGPTK